MYSDHTLPNLRMGQHLSSSFPAYLSKSRPEVMKSEFPPARLTSGRCGNFCELALCSTLCLLPQVLTCQVLEAGYADTRTPGFSSGDPISCMSSQLDIIRWTSHGAWHQMWVFPIPHGLQALSYRWSI